MSVRTPTAPLHTHCTAGHPLHRRTPTALLDTHYTTARPLYRWTSTAPLDVHCTVGPVPLSPFVAGADSSTPAGRDTLVLLPSAKRTVPRGLLVSDLYTSTLPSSKSPYRVPYCLGLFGV